MTPTHAPSFYPHLFAICELGIKNQQLLDKCISFGHLETAQQLQRLDKELWCLYRYKGQTFDLVSAIADGKTLLVGEGNLSFACSLIRKSRITPSQIVATTFKATNELSELAAENMAKLMQQGVTVMNGVDATRLASALENIAFDNIVFQFPHVGSREPVEGHNPNFILIRDFLKSAARHLTANGQVIITAVDTPHYRGAFQFEEAARFAGFRTPEAYTFDPSDFLGYTHTMTHDDEGALDHHDSFSTWIFRR